MICESRHCKIPLKPGITPKMDEWTENALTTVSLLALSYLKVHVSMILSCCTAWTWAVGWAVSPYNQKWHSDRIQFSKALRYQKWTFAALPWQNSFLLFLEKLEQPFTVGNGKKKKELRLKACPFLEKQDALGREQSKWRMEFCSLWLWTIWLQCAQSRCVCGRLSLECLIACCIGQLLTHAEVVVVLTTVY